MHLSIEVPPNKLCLVSHDTAISEWHKCLAFVPDTTLSKLPGANYKILSIFIVVPLDGFITATVSCFQDHATNNAEGHRQKLYYYKLASFFSCLYPINEVH